MSAVCSKEIDWPQINRLFPLYKIKFLLFGNYVKCVAVFFIWLLSCNSFADQLNESSGSKPARLASLVIDDLGYNLNRGRRAIELSGAVSYSILPATPYAQVLANLAYKKNKEVLLHLPMEGSMMYGNESSLLTSAMTEEEFRIVLQKNIVAVPHAVGVNNHMGSTLTPMLPQMTWLMEELSKRTLFFVDSRTTHRTVALSVAQEFAVPVSKRDIFLDNDKSPEKIRLAFKRFVERAKKQQGVLAIAHPYPETLEVLEEELTKLSENGIQLVPVAELIRYQSEKNMRKMKKPGEEVSVVNVID